MTAQDGGKSVSRDIVSMTLAGYLVQPIMFFSNILVRRELGPFLTGVMGTLTIIQTYAQLSSLGVLQVAERDLPLLRGAGDQSRFSMTRATSFLVALGAGILVSVGLLAYAIWSRASLDPSLFRGLVVYSGVILVTQWASAQLVVLRANLRFAFLSRFSVVTALLSAVLNVSAVNVAGFDGLLAVALVVALVSATVYTRVGGTPITREDTGPLRAEFWATARSMVGMGLPMLVLLGVQSVLHTIDNVMALRLLGTEWLGRYSLALSGGAVLYSFGNSISMVLYPHMQVAFGKERDPAALAPFVERPMKMLAAGLPLLIAPLFFGLPVLVRGFLPKFIPGVPAFQCLVIGISFYALALLPHLSLLSLNKIPYLVGWTLATIAVAIGASYGFVAAGLGLLGIALAITLAYLTFFGGLSALALSFWTSRLATVTLLTRVVFTILVAALLLLAADYLPLPEPIGFLTDIAVGVARVAMFLSLYFPFLMLTDGETGLLREHIYPTGRRLWSRFARARAA